MTIDIDDYRGVWVFVEQHDGEAVPVSWELLTKGRELADEMGEPLTALVMGDGVSHLADEAVRRGADHALLADDPVFEPYRADPYGEQFRTLVEERKPSIVLIGGTHTGRDFAGRVAVPAHAGLTADCTELDVDDEGLLLASRPTFGGDAMATIKCPSHRPQMATVRAGVFDASDPVETDVDADAVEEVSVVVEEKDTLSKVIERVVSDVVDITDADVVVAGGAGCEGNFGPIVELAEALGGEVAASRAAVDEGWVEPARQVGQTGKTVRPHLYIAAGISGAVQHLEGMNDSDYVVAINTDPNAAIFDNADYGIVGDLHEVLPQLTAMIREKQEVVA
ncbi:electron transfer flavoprotein subunit alpha/FixB family protein [Haloferax sp. DFSO52]|uniref:electron transfer flavoprotein subunit alpha/FixB family protein n=1 Tax=Haloferax sp. DFSO52 TaxID=3388505 RepID=UPI003A8B348B